MDELRLDLNNLKKSGLFVEEYIVLQVINEGINPETLQWTDKMMLRQLEDNMYIKHSEGEEYQLRQKGRDLFDKPNSEINFDEMWDAFPATTSDGRVLRSANKLWQGIFTKDYLVCKKKYLSKVKKKVNHDKIVEVIKARVASGDTKYMSNLETYINGEKWTQDVKYLTMKPAVEHQRITAR